VLLAAKKESPDFPEDTAQYETARLEQRVDHFGRLTAQTTKGTLTVTSRSGHFIQLSEPELVSQAIRRVLSVASTHPELERFVGTYPLSSDFVITISRDADRLVAQATGQPALAMVAASPTTFAIADVAATIEFEVDAAGRATALVLVQGGKRQRAPRRRLE
jgi:hypothetical protein